MDAMQKLKNLNYIIDILNKSSSKTIISKEFLNDYTWKELRIKQIAISNLEKMYYESFFKNHLK